MPLPQDEVNRWEDILKQDYKKEVVISMRERINENRRGIVEDYDEILNFYNKCSSNAMAESLNAKIKLFRANLRGVVDKKFFLFRVAKLFA